MNFLDYFVLIIIVVSTTFGAMKGILRGVISLASTLLGFLAATMLYSYAAVLFKGFVETDRAANLLGFIAVFVLFIIAGSFLAHKLRGALKKARLDWIDRAAGGAFGFVRGWLACSVLYLALTAFPVRIEAIQKATFAPLLLEGTRVIAYLTSPAVRESFFVGYREIREFWKQREIKKK